MPAPTFKEYVLKIAEAPDNIIGDFIRDVRSDPTFPNITKEDKLIGYLNHKRACLAAFDAAHDIWETYERYIKRGE